MDYRTFMIVSTNALLSFTVKALSSQILKPCELYPPLVTIEIMFFAKNLDYPTIVTMPMRNVPIQKS